jgi:predicted nucleotide-binding protein
VSWQYQRACNRASEREQMMGKPRIFLGSSGKQEKLLQALTRGLSDIAHVEPWTTTFNPGISTLERLVELTREVDFAAFVFAQDDWTMKGPPDSSGPEAAQASPRDNVVFEAGLFGGVLGLRRTFILHANGSKLPSDLLGLTCVRYPGEMTPSEMRVVNQKIRKAIENEGRLTRIEGEWWQFSLTERSSHEPSALGLLKVSRDRSGALAMTGRAWRGDGRLSARYWSEAVREKDGSSGLFYYWKGERPLDLNAPQLEGTGEIRLESDDRASGYFITRSDADPNLSMRTAGVYWRADPDDMNVMDGRDDRKRVALIAERLTEWEAFRNHA